MKFLVFFLRNGTRFEVELFVAEGDDHLIPGSWDYMLASERTLQRTGSEASLVTIKGWIAGCIVDHHTPESFCDSPERPHLPTRVVDVGLDDGIVKLVETNGARSKYICLSHCWGVSQVLTTTKSTLEQHKKGKIWDRLPKTFQDAISLIQPPI